MKLVGQEYTAPNGDEFVCQFEGWDLMTWQSQRGFVHIRFERLPKVYGQVFPFYEEDIAPVMEWYCRKDASIKNVVLVQATQEYYGGGYHIYADLDNGEEGVYLFTSSYWGKIERLVGKTVLHVLELMQRKDFQHYSSAE